MVRLNFLFAIHFKSLLGQSLNSVLLLIPCHSVFYSMSPNSTTSSQNAAIEPGPMANVGVAKDPAADMMNNLKQYYNENLVNHVSGWQAEHAERQVFIA